MPARLKTVLFLIAFMAIFLFSPRQTKAAMSLTFSGVPSSLFEEEAFEVDVSLIDAPTNRIYYLRAVFYEEGKTQYFGYTYNYEGNWHNSPSEYQKFFQITTNEEGSWSGKLKAKADLGASAFKGGGNYGFKIGRYTEGGSGPTWSDNTATIAINVSPSPTPSLSSEEPISASPEPSSSSQSEETDLSVQTPSPQPMVVTGATFLGRTLGESQSTFLAFYPWEATEEGEGQEATENAKIKSLPKIIFVLGLIFLLSAATHFCYNLK